jgi:lipopolysaccharide assembly outer membrane protein LptD (OstA)
MLRTIAVIGMALLLQSAPTSAEDAFINVQVEKNTPSDLQADELIDDRANEQIVVKGNVTFRYKGYALFSDNLIYDRKLNRLSAIGNVHIEEPDRTFITAERITLFDEFRDEFMRSIEAKDARFHLKQ